MICSGVFHQVLCPAGAGQSSFSGLVGGNGGGGAGEEGKAEQEKGGSPLWESGQAQSGSLCPQNLKELFNFPQHHLIFYEVIVKYFRCTRRYENDSYRQHEGAHFPLFLRLSAAKILEIGCKANIRRLRGEGEKGDQLGTPGPE